MPDMKRFRKKEGPDSYQGKSENDSQVVDRVGVYWPNVFPLYSVTVAHQDCHKEFHTYNLMMEISRGPLSVNKNGNQYDNGL